MKISVNALAEYIDIQPLKTDLRGVLERLTQRGLEVEAIHDLSKGFENVVVAQVIERGRHPNADKLSLCKVNDGRETLQIVCGAQNFKSGDKVILSRIGASLPNGLKIAASKIRDVESFGMLCSEQELGLKDKAEGILVLPDDAPVGMAAAEYLGRTDVIFHINVTPNRGDALSFVGVARELASILGQTLKLPANKLSTTSQQAGTKLKVSLEEGQFCHQYHARYLEGVKVGPSPAWLRQRLEASGVRVINNIVDITNFVLLEYGTPLHAFDYDLLAGAAAGPKAIRIRKAHPHEKIPLLDGTTAELADDDLVIADAEKPIALAGVMGGANSEVSEGTQRVVLEAAEFAYTAVRRTARRHGKHTEASQRFERRIDGLAVTRAMDRAAALMVELAGAKVYDGAVTAMAKGYDERLRELKEHRRKITLDVARFNRAAGLALKTEEIAQALKAAGFPCERAGEGDGARLLVAEQSHRSDVALVEDLYEEVLRVVGYDKVPVKMPALPTALDGVASVSSKALTRARLVGRLKGVLAAQGFSECVNFAFTSKAKVEKWLSSPQQSSQVVTLRNPLNEEFSTMKTTLLGGLFENLVQAVNHQQRQVRLFEARPVYFRDEASETGVREEWRLAALMTGRSYSAALAAQDRDLDFFEAKGVFESLVEALGVRGVRYQELRGAPEKGPAAPTDDYTQLHPYQGVRLLLGPGPCGVLGRLHPRIEGEEKIRQPVFVFEVSLDRLVDMAKGDRKYSPVARFPKVSRDYSFLVPDTMAAEKVATALQKLGKPLVEEVQVIDLYQGGKIPEGQRSVSFSVVMGDPARTLEDGEVDAVSQKLIAGLAKELGVTLRSE